MGIFDDLDTATGPEKGNLIRAPFGYPGGKYKAMKHILPHLPLRHSYIVPFGGSAVDILNRVASQLEVYNDIHSGIVCFYRVMRDPAKYERLREWLNLTVNSKEEWFACKNWAGYSDEVEIAARWYYLTVYSFSGLARNWGRSKGSTSFSGKIRRNLKHFHDIHTRFRDVQIENSDWRDIVADYDSPSAVFYMDPPYVETGPGTYENVMSVEDHKDLLAEIFRMDAFVAVSGYPNVLYDSQNWDRCITYETPVTVHPAVNSAVNKKAHLEGEHNRRPTTESLWIKEAHGK